MKLAQDQIRRLHVLRDPPAYVSALVEANRQAVILRDKEITMKLRLRRVLPGEPLRLGDLRLAAATHTLEPLRLTLWNRLKRPCLAPHDQPTYRIEAP